MTSASGLERPGRLRLRAGVRYCLRLEVVSGARNARFGAESGASAIGAEACKRTSHDRGIAFLPIALGQPSQTWAQLPAQLGHSILVMMTGPEFRAFALSNPFNAQVLDRLASLDLPECYLTAGCLFQTIWNERSGNAPNWGIKDYDVFYFDDKDLSWDAEDNVIRQVAEATADLPIEIEVKNQARVHIWYGDRFGGSYPQLCSVRAGIGLYLVSCTCVGIEVKSRDVYAPYGLDDLAAGRLAMNPSNPKPDQFRAKAESYQSRWPWLKIVE